MENGSFFGLKTLKSVILNFSEGPCWLFVATFLPNANKFLQSYARKLRAPALTCAQNDRFCLSYSTGILAAFLFSHASKS